MRIKKLILAVLIALTLLGLFPLASSAAPGWYFVRVRLIGPTDDGNIYAQLADTKGAFDKWFKCSPSIANRQMAVALTAMTNSLTVAIYADPDEPEANRWIINMFLYAD